MGEPLSDAHCGSAITSWPGTDTQPMWIGDAVYFLSDRDDWKLNLWRYDVASKETTRVTRFTEFVVDETFDGSSTSSASPIDAPRTAVAA